MLWRGLVRDQVRIRRLCRQVEKLSYMLQYIEDETAQGIRDGYTGMVSIDDAEAAWLRRGI